MSRFVLRGIWEDYLGLTVLTVGGHFTPDCCIPALSVSTAGRADSLLTSLECEEGDAYVLAIDTDGRLRVSFLYLDTTPIKEGGCALLPESASVDRKMGH